MIQTNFFPSVLRVFGELNHFILLDENCGLHRTTVVKELLSKLGVERMFWTPENPHLNCIESVWGFLKGNLRKRKNCWKNEDELFELLSNLWNAIPQSYFQELVGETGRRVSPVLEANGGATKY